MTINAWKSDGFYLPWPKTPLQSMTLLANVHKGRRVLSNLQAYGSWPHQVHHIAVVFRAVPEADLTDTRGPSQSPRAITEWAIMNHWEQDGLWTFVNISEETEDAVGIKCETDETIEEAFHRAFENSWRASWEARFPHRWPNLEEDVRLLRKNVRVLSMEEWMAEASYDDREACLHFW
jgi:hypothetical protein